MTILIFIIGVLVFMAHMFTALFERTKIPDVLLLTILGILAGPVFGFVTLDDFGKVGIAFTAIALIVILFEGGTSLEIPTTVRSASETLVITLVTFVATVALASGVMVWVFGSLT